jgi:methionine synthase II (cobalamin-independent)
VEIEKVYNNIIEELKAGKRALIKLDSDQISELENLWKSRLEKDSLHQLLCILDHSIDTSTTFSPHISKELIKENDRDTIIFLLGAAQKHVIAAHAKDGFPPPADFIEALNKIFESKHIQDPETFEWILRTVEQMGMKSILFKKVILKNKPGLGSLFNQHKKACKDIIELLERRWAPLQGGPLG